MLRTREGKRLWIETEGGDYVPVRSREDISKHGRKPGDPDWWVVAKDPDWPPLMPGVRRDALSARADERGEGGDEGGGEGGAGTGDGMKIGAGNKPQPYGWHGWYGSTGKALSGMGKEGGKVSKKPAEVTWKNDERGKPDPKPEDLRPRTRETVDRLSKEVPGIKSLNVNSGLRPGDAGPHGDGTAVDMHKVNDVRLETIAGRTDAKAEQTRQDVKRIEEWARENPDIQAFFSPDGGFIRDPKSGEIWREATRDEIKEHKNHIHITVRK